MESPIVVAATRTRANRVGLGSRHLRIAAIVVPLYVVGGCADLSQVSSLEKRVADLEKKAVTSSSEVEKLKDSVKQLEQSKSYDEFMRNFDSIAYLTPGSGGYSVIQTDLGRITVMLENVQPYANGSRVTLQFGNLTSATINGAKATVEWGSVDAKGSANNDTARTREVTFSRSLRGGSWTEVPVVLEGVPPSALGFVRIREITHTGIVLLK
jgi:hypothetical protein